MPLGMKSALRKAINPSSFPDAEIVVRAGLNVRSLLWMEAGYF